MKNECPYTICAVMAECRTDALAQMLGCNAICNLAQDSKTKKEQNAVLIKAGSIAAVLAAMTMHATNANVQLFGCAAIWNLAATAENASQLVKAGGVSALVHAMKILPTDNRIQIYGCRALHSFAAFDIESHAVIAAKDGVTFIRRAMAANPSCQDVWRPGCAVIVLLDVSRTVVPTARCA